MSKNIVLNNRSLLLCYFVILVLTIFAPSSKVIPPFDVLIIQCMMTIVCCSCISISKHTKVSTLLLMVFLIHLFFSVLIRIMYVMHWNDPFGPVVFDALDYHLDAVRYSHMSFSDFVDNFFKEADLDDFGFSCILYFTYSIFGPEAGINVMLLINSLLVTLTCKYVYKISNKYLTPELARLAVVLIGITAFSMTTAAKGLKENIFVLIVVSATYFLLEYNQKRNLIILIKYIIVASISVLFRLALLPIFIFAFFSKYFQSILKKRYIVILLIIIFAAIYIGFRVMKYLLVLRGFSDGSIIEQYESQYSENSFSGLSNTIVNIVFGVLGAVPSFISHPDKVQYITLNNFTLFVSLFSGSLFITGIYKIIRNKNALLPLVIISLLNILMITVMSFSFDFRYRFVIFPLTIIISLYSLQNIGNHEKMLHKSYLYGCSVLIIVYNIFLG